MLTVASKVELVDQVSEHERVLALFSSSKCPFCQRFTQVFNKYVTNCKVNLVIHVNMDDYNSPLWDEYNIDAVPTLILFENNTIKNRLDASSGIGLTEDQLTKWIKTVNSK